MERGVDGRGEELQGLCDEHAAVSKALGKKKTGTFLQILTVVTDVRQHRPKEKQT